MQTLRKLSQELWLRAPEALARFMQVPQSIPYCFNSYPCSSELCVRSAYPELLCGGLSSNKPVPLHSSSAHEHAPKETSFFRGIPAGACHNANLRRGGVQTRDANVLLPGKLEAVFSFISFHKSPIPSLTSSQYCHVEKWPFVLNLTSLSEFLILVALFLGHLIFPPLPPLVPPALPCTPIARGLPHSSGKSTASLAFVEQQHASSTLIHLSKERTNVANQPRH